MSFLYDIRVDRGTSTDDLNLTYSAGSPPTPVDLTGCAAWLEVRPSPDATILLARWTSQAGRIVLGGTLGTIGIRLRPIDTNNVVWSNAVYQLRLQYPNTSIKKLASGKFIVTPWG